MASNQNPNETSNEVLDDYIKAYHDYKNNDTTKTIEFEGKIYSCKENCIALTKEYNDKIVYYYEKCNNYNEMLNYRKDFIDYLESWIQYNDAAMYCVECIKLSDLMNDNTLANLYRLRAANLFASGKKYDMAAKHFSELAMTTQKSEYYMNAILCHIKCDIAIANASFDAACIQHPPFSASNEYKFVSQVLEAITKSNLDMFMNTITTYDNIKKLGAWQTSLLLSIKACIMGINN